jgi:hypothetical protein
MYACMYVYFGSPRVQVQSLMLARQARSHLSLPPTPSKGFIYYVNKWFFIESVNSLLLIYTYKLVNRNVVTA